MTNTITFYIEYVDKNGHHHYSVNKYNTTTGIVEYPLDHFFD